MSRARCTCDGSCQMHPRRPGYSYENARAIWLDIIDETAILAGDKVGPRDASWQDVAGTLAVHLRMLALRIDCARRGEVVNGPVVFPSLAELVGGQS